MDVVSPSGIEPVKDSKLTHDRERFLVRCSAVPAYRPHVEALRSSLDFLIEWSARHGSILYFVPATDLDQDSVAFRKRSDDNVFWKAYPGGPSSEPFVEFFTRGQSYLSEAERNAVAEQWQKLPGMANRRWRSGEVMRLPLRTLSHRRMQGPLLAFLDWAATELVMLDGGEKDQSPTTSPTDCEAAS